MVLRPVRTKCSGPGVDSESHQPSIIEKEKEKMKKVTALLAVLSLTVCAIAGCAQSTAETTQPAAAEAETPSTEIIVFAAASMTETLEQIVREYEAANPGVTITCNFDSSGTLKTQIEEGAECDLFISAAPKQMDQLDVTSDSEKNPDGLDFIDHDTRINILENKVVLAVPDDNPKNINSYDDMVKGLKDKSILMAMGNEDVPVGQYTQKILAFYDLDEEQLAKDGVITYGSNVKEVTTQVKEAAVDCGIIYSTDAYPAELKSVDTATPEMCGQVIYPAAVLKNSKDPEAAKAFLDYLTGEESSKIFESAGFTCIK